MRRFLSAPALAYLLSVRLACQITANFLFQHIQKNISSLGGKEKIFDKSSSLAQKMSEDQIATFYTPSDEIMQKKFRCQVGSLNKS